MTTVLPDALKGRQFAVVDVEGSGHQPPEIIELSVLPVDAEVSAELMRTWLVRPARGINPLVTRTVHGISNVDVADCPPWAAVQSEVAPMLAGRVLVAHNAAVELKVLSAHLPDWTPPMVLDTLRLARKVVPDADGGHNLDNLVHSLEIDVKDSSEQRYHRAAYDTWCAWKLLLRLIEQGGIGSWRHLVELAGLPALLPPKEPEGGLW